VRLTAIYDCKNIAFYSKFLLDLIDSLCYITIQYSTIKAFKEATCQEPAKTRKLSIHVKTIDRYLAQVDLDKIALTSKFYQRKPQKINAFLFVKSLCYAVYQDLFSYSKLAFLLGLLGANVSKQGVSERINRYAVVFMKQVLNAVINSISGIDPVYKTGAFKSFRRVYLQDSTNLSLPEHLSEFYPGSKNQSNKKCAGMKIQAVFNLINERLSDFSLSSFRRNDQAASKDILRLIKKNDLVIRDLGYFAIPVFEKLINMGAFFLSRFRNDVALYQPGSGKRINLLALLKKHSSLDIEVLLGAKHRLPVRLVALPVPDNIANERRRKAKKNRDRRCNPSKETLQLLGWQIFVSNVGRDIWDPTTIQKVYAIRWRIEIIFKAWKSHLSLNKIPQTVNKNQLDVYIYSHLLNIIFFHVFFDHLNQYMIARHNRSISMLKIAPLFDQITRYIFLLSDTPNGKPIGNLLEQLLLRHCCYEKRKKRSNHYEQLEFLACLA